MPFRLMAVHPHPDDESIACGGILAKYVDEGAEVVLVTCTLGEAGEISDPALATPEVLGQVRAGELAVACAILGVRERQVLGFRDSGMAGTPENQDPRCFHQADLQEAAGRLVALVRRYRPQVMVSDNEYGTYGHPDHIKANRITVAAFQAAGNPARYPGLGLPAWQPAKLYFTAMPYSRRERMAQRLEERGIASPFRRAADAATTVERPFGTPDELVTTTIDVTAYASRKRQAVAAHRTQMGPEQFFMRLPEDLWAEFFGVECFQLVESRVPAPEREDDLFAGISPME